MKKVILFLTILSFFLFIGLAYFSVVSSRIPPWLVKETDSIDGVTKDVFLAKQKYFGVDREIIRWIETQEYTLRKQAYAFKNVDKMQEILDVFNFLATHYQYQQDENILYNGNEAVLKAGKDNWLPPLMVQAMIVSQNVAKVDCEDGTFYLTTLLRILGHNAWANVGYVEVNEKLYGHAWVTIELEGKEYLLETTLEKPIDKLQEIPPIYHTVYKFNEKDVVINTASNNIPEVEPMTPDAINELREYLDK